MSRIDLSKLPEPVRERLQQRLDRLPAELRERMLTSLGRIPAPMLEQLMEHGSPMLDKMLDKLEQQLPKSARTSTTSSSKSNARPGASPMPIAPAGLYSKTVQRGDNLSLRTLMVAAIFVGIIVLLFKAGFLTGAPH